MKKVRRRLVLFIAGVSSILLLGLGFCLETKAAVTVRREKMALRTYPFFDPDPVARPGPIYPYFRFQGYSLQPEEKVWDMVKLENNYLEVVVAPEVGGKVWGAKDKASDRDFIYWNPVVKFREIALRGPWTSGGIEFNFGIIGHAPTTATPVDLVIEEKEDGRAACVVGALDLPSRTRWQVRVSLPPDAAIIETEGFWFNPTPFHDSLYHWMTAAAPVGPDLHFFHPGTNFIGHGGEPGDWPQAPDGRDLSYYAQNNFGGSKSYHILGEYGEFFAGIWEKDAFGYGHFSFYPDKPGMKLWIWSLARDGEIWRDLLTDPPKPQYIEMQTGFLYNQAAASSSLTPFKHAYFLPYHAIHWKEYWFPIKGLKRVVAASPSGALNVEERQSIDREKRGPGLKIEFCPVIKAEKELRVEADEKLILKESLKLEPLRLWSQEIALPENWERLKVVIGEGEIIWTNEPKEIKKLKRPVEPLPGFNWESAEGLYISGEEFSRQRRWEEAREAFIRCLKKEPGHLRALTRLAELELRAARPEIALNYARQALMIDTYDPAANFVYGAINRRLGLFADALDGFSWASRSLDYRSAAYTEMAEIFFLKKDFWRAKEYLNRALAAESYNLAAREIGLIMRRQEGQKEAAAKEISDILSLEPLNHLARFEAYKLNPSEATKQAFISAITNELPHETYLELAFRYKQLGLDDEAVTLLELAPPHPLVDLTMAYWLQGKDEKKSLFFLQRALEDKTLQPSAAADKEAQRFTPALRAADGRANSTRSSFYLVFPYRQEMIPLLEWALKERPHWKLNYGLALIFWNLGREDEAERFFLAGGDEPDYSPFYLTRARFNLDRGKEARVLSDIERAIALDPKSWRAWHELITFYERQGEDGLALKSAQKIYPVYPQNTALILDLARALKRNGKLKEMLNFLNQVTILPYEGAWEGRDLYRQANLLLAAEAMSQKKWADARRSLEAARRWPENLGAGRPYQPDERLEFYLLGLVEEKRGKQELSRKYYEEVGRMTTGREAEPACLNLVSLLARKKLGERQSALLEGQNWLRKWPDRAAVAWAASILRQDYQMAAKIASEWLERNQKKSLWNLGEADHYWPLLLTIVRVLNSLE